MTNQQSKDRELLDTLLHAKRHKFGVLSTISLLPDEIDTLRSALALKVAVENLEVVASNECWQQWIDQIEAHADNLLAQVDSNPPSIPDYLKAGPLSSAIARGLTHEEHKAEWEAKHGPIDAQGKEEEK